MSYTLLTGRFVIRYADLPREGPEPHGDNKVRSAITTTCPAGCCRTASTRTVA